VKIGIVDYGLGNVGSIRIAFQRLGVSTFLSSDERILRAADGLVLPGVGAFSTAMEQIRKKGLDRLLKKLVKQEKKPLLGICLGMQILAEWGEEFVESRGLGMIRGRVRKLQPGRNRKIPHVGWSQIHVHPPGMEMFSRALPSDAYYFDHSYAFEVKPARRAATVSWDGQVVAGVVQGRVWGVQFHPEKSQNAGLRLLKAFCVHSGQG
jgi:glutamine amidotransferase